MHRFYRIVILCILALPVIFSVWAWTQLRDLCFSILSGQEFSWIETIIYLLSFLAGFAPISGLFYYRYQTTARLRKATRARRQKRGAT
ncbi:DUF2627 family protein [Pasteuria penetrans]|uniref:DUF2627 family protein n=1 Tax=Pasteuria penetrans TaxID=86005 RepID=UPI000F9162A3|nr:DUF2627 family protein [Pasteuria penetrans]